MVGSKRSKNVKVTGPRLTDYEATEPPNYDTDPTLAKLWAKAAWFTERYTNQELADLINVSSRTINYWVKGNKKSSGWLYEKEKYEKKAIKKAVRNNSNRMDGILSQMLDVFEKGIKDIKDSNHSISIQEMSALSNSFEKLFKARQLSVGGPTDIYMGDNGRPLSWGQIKEQLQAVDILDYSLEPVNGKNVYRNKKLLNNCPEEDLKDG